MNAHPYTPEEVAFLAANVAGRPFKELQAMFNQRFGLDLSEPQISAACGNRGLHNGLRGGQFKPGHAGYKPPKGARLSPATEFKKGNMPQTWRPVGSETLRDDGYVWVKIAEPRYWRQKHVLIWESLHGPRPAKHVIIFSDRNRLNFDPDNLLLISQKELAVMNKAHLIGSSRELTEAGKLIARVKMKTTEVLKRCRHNRRLPYASSTTAP